MHAVMPKQMLRSTHFSPDARIFDEDMIPRAALAAKKEVVQAKRPDIIGVSKPTWNASTQSEGMRRFPDRPMMRQLSQFDSIKRADYNFRAETLDWRDKRLYEPKPNKFQVNRRTLGRGAPMLDAPPALSRTEFAVHPAIASKPQWDSTVGWSKTGDEGDYLRVNRERNKRIEEETQAHKEWSRRHPAKKHHESLIERELRSQQEKRAAKALARADAETAKLMGLPPGSAFRSGTWAAHNTLAASSREAPALSEADKRALDVTQQVPVRQMTTWSLGGF
mmetsp:Transcript_36727/g.91445  ORF Transcript_36727/g.91445 Transcript_36727/m.91445 type:complete len:279 (+) Transcript_36727:97-933(+)